MADSLVRKPGQEAERLTVLLVGFSAPEASDLAIFLQSVNITCERWVGSPERIEQIHGAPFPVVLLRWPSESAEEATLISRLRELPRWIPVIALGEADREEARREALGRGADIFLRARSSREELLAILRSLGRRHASSPPVPLGALPVTLEPRNRLVRCGGRIAALTPTEFAIVRYLFRNAGRLVLSEELAAQLRPRPGRPPSLRRLQVHLFNLRRKLHRSAMGIALRSVRGKGLLLERRPEPPLPQSISERRTPDRRRGES